MAFLRIGETASRTLHDEVLPGGLLGCAATTRNGHRHSIRGGVHPRPGSEPARAHVAMREETRQ